MTWKYLDVRKPGMFGVPLPDGRLVVDGVEVWDDDVDDVVSARVDFARAAGPWTASGNLNVARFGAATALLPDGRVLVCGGFNAALAPLASAEIYDPIAGTWTATGVMGTARGVPTATLLNDGRVLVVGGYANLLAPPSAIGSAEIYDPATGAFAPTGAMAVAHGGHKAVLLRSGFVLVAGGSVSFTGAAIANCDLYDPATDTWWPTGALNAARGGLTATLLADGRVLAAGGANPYPVGMTACEIFNPGTGAWAPTGALATARTAHGAALLASGLVLVAGGVVGAGVVTATSATFDPATGLWTAAGPLPATAGALSGNVMLLPSGQALAVGGADGPGAARATSSLYDPSARAWTASDSMTESRFLASTVLLPDGRIVTAGGAAALPGAVRVSTNLYDPAVPALAAGAVGAASVTARGPGRYRLTLTAAALAALSAGDRHVVAAPASLAQPCDPSAQLQQAQVVATDLTAGTVDVLATTNPVGVGPAALPFTVWIR